MKRQVFYDPREIAIEVSDDHIAFFFEDNVRRQEQWISEQEYLGYEVSEEDKIIHEFYWIDSWQWVKDKIHNPEGGDNWHNHMKEKNWFTDEMYDFIEKHL